MAHERGGGKHVHVGPAHAVVPEVVDVAGEDRLDRRLPDLVEQPRARRLVDVVVAAALVGTVDVRRIVHEQEHAKVARGVDLPREPCALARLVGESGVQQQGVQHDEAHPRLVERVEVFPERRPPGREMVVADPIRRHPVDGLVAHVVVAGNDVQGDREPGGDALEVSHRIMERRQRRDRVHDVPQMHHEARRRAHRRDLREYVARPGVGEAVGLVGGGRYVLAFVDVGVGDHDEGEQRTSSRRGGGLSGHARSPRAVRTRDADRARGLARAAVLPAAVRAGARLEGRRPARAGRLATSTTGT